MTAMPGEFPAREAIAPSCLAERILTAAAEECTLVGVKHITIADIARRAEVDVDSVYEQWRSVGELVVAVVIRDLQQRIDAMAKLIRAQRTLDDKIVEAFASILTRCVWMGRPLTSRVTSAPSTALPPWLDTPAVTVTRS